MTDPELLALLERAKGHKMTPAELREQRISFVYGNIAMENPTITREQVEAILFGEDDRARAAAEYVRATANMSDDAAARYQGTDPGSDWSGHASEKDYGI
jgi:hypothetical protein